MPFQTILRALSQIADNTLQYVQINMQTAHAVKIPPLPSEQVYDVEMAFREQLVLIMDR